MPAYEGEEPYPLPDETTAVRFAKQRVYHWGGEAAQFHLGVAHVKHAKEMLESAEQSVNRLQSCQQPSS